VSPTDAALAVRECGRQRITVVNSNWPKVVDPQGFEKARINAHRAATFGLDIPVHQNLSTTDLQSIASAFRHAKPPDWEVLR
jgi:dTDP-4-amino-4,6-dideoxygalactose transaminase